MERRTFTITLEGEQGPESFPIVEIRPEQGSYPPVVLLHGLGLDHRSFLPLAESLAGYGFPVYLYDQRGFGSSPLPRTDPRIEHYREDLEGILKALDLPPFHLVGHSFGGMVALEFAVENEKALRSLTLISTTAHNGRRASRFARAMSELCARGYERFVQDAQKVKEVEALLSEAFPGMGMRVSFFEKAFPAPDPGSASAWRALSNFSVKDRISRIFGLPVLVSHGSFDTWIPYSCGVWLGEKIPGARWVPIEGGGHFPHEEKPEFFRTTLLDFLLKNS